MTPAAAQLPGGLPTFACSGPGAGAMGRLASAWPWPRGVPVILAGVAGSLGELAPGTATWVTAIHDSPHRPSLPRRGAPPRPACVLTASEPIHGANRARRRTETCADLVDLESAGFAEAAVRAGVPWGIVRGISDGPTLEPPVCIWNWVDARGRTRALRVARDLALGPTRLGPVMALRAATAAALRSVAGHIVRELTVE